MRVADFIKINQETMKILSKFDIKTNDYKYSSLYFDYETMVKNKEKVSYIVAVLSVKYSISEATVYRLLKRFKQTL